MTTPKHHYGLVINGGKKTHKEQKEGSAMLAKFFGPMLAKDITVHTCNAYREIRRKQGRKHTTINRELSKVSVACKLGVLCGKLQRMPPGGCGFYKKPQTENTRRVRLPDRYYAFFRDALVGDLQCLFVVAYNIGRRKSELLGLRWDRVDFDERCIYFEKTKWGPGKAPFFGEMERYSRKQKERRDSLFPRFPYVFFWSESRIDRNGTQLKRFDTDWDASVDALKKNMKSEGPNR
jgi:integrase